MKKILIPVILALVIGFASCDNKETPQSVADKWCEMTKKIKEAEGDEKDKLEEERQAYEESIETKYKDDEDFMNKVEELADKCE